MQYKAIPTLHSSSHFFLQLGALLQAKNPSIFNLFILKSLFPPPYPFNPRNSIESNKLPKLHHNLYKSLRFKFLPSLSPIHSPARMAKQERADHSTGDPRAVSSFQLVSFTFTSNQRQEIQHFIL